MEDWARSTGVDLLVIRSFQAPISPIKDIITFVKLLGLFWKEKPLIVHTHTFKAGLLGRLAAWFCGVPVIVHTYHGHLLSGYWSHTKTQVVKSIERLLSLVSTKIVAVSRRVADDLVSEGIVPDNKVQVVELGFDVASLEKQLKRGATLRQDLNLPGGARVVGIVGRLVPVKAVDLFLNSLAPLLKERSNLHLVVIGDGTEADQLKSLAASLSSERIHFCGWRLPVVCDLPDLDICVCSSRNEGTSVSIIESVIAQTPVICTRVGGMGDLLENGRWGELVEFDADSLRERVEMMLDTLDGDKNSRAFSMLSHRTEEASQVFKTRFSVDRLLTDTEKLYRELLVDILPTWRPIHNE